TFPIIPEHGFKSTAEAIKGDGAFIPMGSGQYKCDSYNATDKLVLAPNENYHGEKAINTLTFEVMPGKENAYKLLETSGISLMISKAMDRETEIRNKSIKIENFPMNEVEFLGFNFYRESLKKPEVRKAIASAVNSESIIEECYYNSGIVNDNLYFPNYMNVDSKQAAYTYDLQKASEYLKDAGYKEDATDGLLRDKNKNVLSMTILVNQTNEARVASAESIKRALTGIGISVTVKAVDDAEYTSSLQKGEFDLYLGAYKYDEQMDMRILFGDSTYNYTGYQNKKLMELMNDMRSGASEETVKKDFEEIRKILIEDLPYVTLLYKTYGAIKAPALQGEVNPVFNNLYRDCGKWQCKYEVMPKAEEEKTK
ncbi:MAG: ABC transporter substrate-binding protein, partial [Anaerovoracaceae bacterium]